MYELENATDALVTRLIDGIINNGDKMGPQEIDALIEHSLEEAQNFAKAIRQTIIDEIEARK